MSIRIRLLLQIPMLAMLLIAALAFWWASQFSLPLAIAAVVAAVLVFVSLMHNYDGILSRPLLSRDDRLLFHACEMGVISRFRRLYRQLPADPRCRICLVPFGGVGRVLRIRPSRKNANFCQSCIESAPMGVHETDVGVLFADIRGFTAYAEANGPTAAAETLSRFYAVAGDALTRDDALVELVGDQVMAFYLPSLPSLTERMPEVMVAAARRLLAAVEGAAGLLPVGVGIHRGTASVGNVGKGGEKDFTVIGDVVNTAARLQAVAGVGQIVVSKAVYDTASGFVADAVATSFELKGKAEPFPAYVINSASPTLP